MKKLLFLLLLVSTLASAQNNNFKWIAQQTYIATGTNTYSATIAGLIPKVNDEVKILFTNGNTGASTFNGVTMRKNGSTALSSGDILPGATYRMTFDGTYWQVLGIGGSGGVSLSGDNTWTGNNAFRNETRTETGTTYTIQSTDEGLTIEFTNSSDITVTLPNGLAQYFNCMLMKKGTGDVIITATGTLEAAGTPTITTQHTGAYVEHKGSNVWEAIGSFGSGGSGTVNSGTQYRLGYYAATGTAISEAAAITANRALISDANGVPTHSSVTNTELGYSSGVTSAIQTQLDAKQALDSDLTTIAGLTATTDNFIQAKSSAWASRTPAQVKEDLHVLYLPLITGYLGSSGSDASIDVATAVDRIPTTGLSVGKRISAIVTISGTQRRLYTAELVTPSDATAGIEVSPSVIRPNDFNISTNNKVWREIRQNGVIDVSNFGVIPSGSVYVSDQINAIITAATAQDALIFPPGNYLIYAITIPNGKPLHFIGNGAVLTLSTVNNNHFVINADGTTVNGFKFVGRGRANATYPAQGAIRIQSCSNVQISDCYFDSMPFYAIQTNSTHISDQSGDFGGINIENVTITRSAYGFYATTRGEYVNIVASTIADNDVGLHIGAGNINVQGSTIIDNLVAFDFVTDVNDAHGVITGNQINHNVLAFRGDGIVNGEFIRDNNIYYGDMEFTDCHGFVFTNNTIEGAELYFDNCTGIQIEGNTFPNTATTTLTTNWNGNASTVFAYNNKTLANEYLSGWNFSALGTTGQRLSKLWATDLEMTNVPIIGTPAKDNAATRILTQNISTGAIEYKDANVNSTSNMGFEDLQINFGEIGASTTSSNSIHLNAYYSNKTTLVATITCVGIKTDGTASVHATVTARFRKDNSGTFNVDDVGTVITSDAAVISDLEGEINGTNPSVKLVTGASAATFQFMVKVETVWATD